MRTSMVGCLVALVALPLFAAGIGLKPGLWQVRIVKQVVDGTDRSSQIASASANMQQALTNMPPEQRARIEALMKQNGGPTMGGDGTIRMCVSPEMANRNNPIIDRDGHCQPATLQRSGNHTTFEFNCTANGITTTGKGESTNMGDLIANQMDTTTHRANGDTHVTHTETEMKFLGSDCGDVKPTQLPKAPP